MCVWILSLVTNLNLTRQMVCYTEPSEKLSLETVWKRAGTFRKYMAGDWMNHLSIWLSLLVLITLKPRL